jgi:hypothetical protein
MSAPNVSKCREEALRAKTWSLSVYEKPSADSKSLGKIHIIGTPGKGLKAQFIPVGGTPEEFECDSKGSDWGYDSFFEFTVSQVEGDWTQLPKRPFQSPVWINLKKDWSTKRANEVLQFPIALRTETVYTVENLGDIVITGFNGKNFSYRLENENDMLCGEDPQKIPSEELKLITKPIDALYDKDGHLIAWPKYTRGC